MSRYDFSNVVYTDCLQARLQFCDVVNKRFDLNVRVYFDDDIESYNFNYMNNIESQAQDGLISQAESGEGDE